MSSINSGIWDTHVHVLNPVQFPFKSSRTYTPEVASLDQLISSSPATNFLLVQASVEDGPDAILHHLDLARRTYPDREFRAEIEVGDDDDDFDGDDDQKLKDLHSRGVRALRLHGVVGISTSTTVDDPTSYIQSRFKRLAKIAARTGWYISAMCPLTTWLALGDWLLSDPAMQGCKIVIEHNACFDAERSLDSYPEFDVLLDLLERGKGRLYVKLCGINRLHKGDRLMAAIPPGVIAIACRVPDSVVWGSDWPHVQYELGDLCDRYTPVAGRRVDLGCELGMLNEALPVDIRGKLMVDNPRMLFK